VKSLRDQRIDAVSTLQLMVFPFPLFVEERDIDRHPHTARERERERERIWKAVLYIHGMWRNGSKSLRRT
jgi:hypothetical protein